MEAEAFAIHAPEPALVDLRHRLAAARFPDDFSNDDWRYGTNGEYLRELVEYWIAKFDWRLQEEALNARHHYRAVIDDVLIHFVHERGHGPRPLPIILTHGWPWTFWDYAKVIGPLVDPVAHGGSELDSFDVVVPSLPGFGFSTPLTRTGITPWSVADLWVRLMVEVLGYQTFCAGGGDWGSVTTAQLGHKYPEQLIGIYLSQVATLDIYCNDRPWDPFGPVAEAQNGSERTALIRWERRFASHIAPHVLSAQTLAYALNDSPVGLCSWLLERRRSWSDSAGDVERRFSKDELLTNVMLYWLTQSSATSARYYSEAAFHPWRPVHDRTPVVEVPTGYSVFLPDAPPLSRAWISDYYNVVYSKEHSSGGQFAPAEEPEAVVEDIRSTFRPLRSMFQMPSPDEPVA